MVNWNSRVLLSLLAAACGAVITHAFVSVGLIPVVTEHSALSLTAVFIGIAFIIYGWVRIFSRKRGYGQRQTPAPTADNGAGPS